MNNYKKLTADDLKIKFDFLPNFDLTSEISPYKDIIGQDRAIEAIDLGLSIDNSGYNIYVSGNNGTGRRSYVLKRIEEYARKFTAPVDWCYIYNFKNSDKPVAVSLNPGTAEKFKQDMEDLIKSLHEEVPAHFSNESYAGSRNEIIEKYQKLVFVIVDKLYNESSERGFDVKSTSDGFAFIPIRDGEEMSERQYNELLEEEKEKINDDVAYLKIVALDVIRKRKILKKELNEELKKLDEENAFTVLKNKIKLLMDKYNDNDKLLNYFYDVQQDIIKNIEAFIGDDEQGTYDENLLKRYHVNILTSNNASSGVPVVYENFPEYHNLFGKIEYENKSGTLVTDFTAIRGGSIHKANGGYIIIDAQQLLTSYKGWETLKRCLINKAISIDNLKNSFDILPIASLKPEEIPLKIKVILVGSPIIYYALFHYDDEFKELFKIKADFENEIGNNNSTVMKMLGFISNFCFENNIPPISRNGVMEILKHSLRLGESKKYFTSSMNNITDLIIQSSNIAKSKGSKYISENHIKEIIALEEKRYCRYKDKIYDMYKNGKYIVEFKQSKIGEVNGLSVIDFGDFSFGRQTRITVATFVGRDGIINIERETKMSGNIHSKGIMILGGYMGETFGQDMSLAFNASICFEQLYGEIDGDSASVAELVALLSSLGNIPIKQSFAITGSVNQRGEIQPVGGINEKIEGFFDICKFLGIEEGQGVIIPYSNIDELLLKDEVIKAVEADKFHIYAVNSVEDCFEILCEDDIRKASKKKAFEVVKKKVTEKLKKYNNVFANGTNI